MVNYEKRGALHPQLISELTNLSEMNSLGKNLSALIVQFLRSGGCPSRSRNIGQENWKKMSWGPKLSH